MNRFQMPLNLKCDSCNNIAIYDCKAMNKKICRLCCDKYQLSHSSIDKCLECNYLFREVGYEVNGCTVYKHEYKEKFIFDSDMESFFLKTVSLYERVGVNTSNEMYNLAIQYLFVNRISEAIDLFNKILNKSISKEDKSVVYEKIGDALLQLHKVEDAEVAYIKSLNYGNKRPYLYRRIGEVYNILGAYSKSTSYHELALDIYFNFDWREDDSNENDDFLYFTNYYSLAMGYSELDNPQKVIENANLFLEYYGDFEYIEKRYFEKHIISGDNFMPESIVSMYKLISLNYIKLNDFTHAKENIRKARSLLKQDVDMAKIEGFIEGKLDNRKIISEFEQLRHSLVEKDRTIMILIENMKDRNVTSYNINIKENYMGNKYNVENNGTIMNQAFGDNVTFNIGDNMLKDVTEILDEIKKNIMILGDKNTQKNIEEIEESIRSKKLSGLKNQLTNLLVGITTNCIANNMGYIMTSISNVIQKFH